MTREFFNTAMGVVPRKAARADRDDEESDAVCTCRYRDPALAPRKGSKEAIAESAAGRSFNCGDECINRLLKIECTDANCGLVASGKTDACGNRLFQRASYFPGVEPFKTEFKGSDTAPEHWALAMTKQGEARESSDWQCLMLAVRVSWLSLSLSSFVRHFVLSSWGLRCPSSSIPAGSFILEYVGEIISNAMCQERMAAENERCRRDNERHMKRREEIRKREDKQRLAMQEAVRKEGERVGRNNPNGYCTRTTPRGSKGAAGAAAATASSSLSSSAAAPRSSSSRGQKKRARIAYDTSALSDSSGDEAEYMEGAGPQSSNFYFLTIGDDVIIDAGVRGGHARFTNHSCAPNCHIEKWTVGDGQVRIGIFANQTIPPGKELTIDYKYDRVGNVHRQACFCGEPNCAKFIGGRKKELEGGDDDKKKVRTRKAKEPTKLHLDLADEVCAMCGDGGDMVACDGRVCGQFCTRCYHLECVGLTEETLPTRWLCPYHSCDGCDSMRIKYWCRTCSESACEKCWNASRLGPLATAVDEPLTLHLTRVRRDLPNFGRNVWTCCHTCQQDAMCLREDERAAAYDACAAFMREAIAARRADPAQAGFGGELDAQTLVEQMDAQTFSPRFLLNYWDVTQQKRGAWDDGYVEPALRGLTEPEEESDEAFLARQYAAANASEGEEEEEEDEDAERKQKDGQPQPIEPELAAPAAAAAAPAALAPAVAAAQPSDEAVPMEVDASDDDEAVAPAAVTRNRKGTKGKRNTGGAAAASMVPVSAAAAAAASVAAAPAAAPPAASSSRRRGIAVASPTVAAVATAVPASAPAAAVSSSSRARGRSPSLAAATAAAASAPSAAHAPAARRRSGAIRAAIPVTPRTRTPSATAVAAAAAAPSSRGKPHARTSGNAALVTALVAVAAEVAVAAAAAAGRSGRAKRKRNAHEQTETESNHSSDSEIDTTQVCAAKRSKRKRVRSVNMDSHCNPSAQRSRLCHIGVSMPTQSGSLTLVSFFVLVFFCFLFLVCAAPHPA